MSSLGIRWSARKCLRWLDRRDTRPIIPMMRLVLTIAAIWATSIAPQLCRIDVLTACCADASHKQPVPERAEACAPGDCDHDCQPPSKEPAPPAEQDCGSCENFCGAVVPTHVGTHTSHVHTQLLTALPAVFVGDNRHTDGSTHYLLQSSAQLPRLPCPSSDLPLLL